MTSASAPGKIILFGEHAVVYGRPALAVPVTQVQATVEVSDSADSQIWIDAPDISLLSTFSALPPTYPLAAVINSVFQFLNISAFPPVHIKIHSTIPVASGLGSGAAVSVALIRALSSTVHRPLSDDEVNALAYETEKLHHGTPSGIDNTVITYARPVYFIKGQPIQTFQIGTPFTIVIADTGISAPTKESVGDVCKLWESDKSRWEAVFDKIGEIVRQARSAIETPNRRDARLASPNLASPNLADTSIVSLLGALMDANHIFLQEMTVSSPELDHLVWAAKDAGALGAKLSGGGRGGNMLALVTPQSAEKVASALRAAGAKNTIITQVE